MTKRQAVLVAVALAIIAVLLYFYAPPQEICEPATQVGQKQCSAYSLPLFLAIQVGEFLDRHNGLIIAIFTGTLWWSTTKLWLSGEAQGVKIERSAAAMEGVDRSMAINAQQIVKSVENQEMFGKMQMRAYVSVGIDENATFQDDSLKFQVRPTLRNTGHTPAQNLRWRIGGGIESVPPPDDLEFPLPPPRAGQNILMPHATATLDFTLPGRIVDELVQTVMRADGWALYVWGVVMYDDVFGDPHESKFAHIMTWIPTGQVREDGLIELRRNGHYLPRHNDAN